jgi:hypothetical protein
MFAMNVLVEFKVDSTLEIDVLFETLSDAIFDLEAANPLVFDADAAMRGSDGSIWLGLVGTGASVDAAIDEAIKGIRAAILASGGSAPLWGATASSDSPTAIYSFVSEEITVADLDKSSKLAAAV